MASILKVDTIKKVDDSIPTAADLGINVTGSVLQMQFTQYTDTTSVSTPSFANTTIDVLAVNITPKSTNSIIKLDTHIFHEWQNSAATYNCAWFFYRDTTKLGHAQAGSRLCGISPSAISFTGSDGDSTPEMTYYSYFDSPNTTSQITYKVGVINNFPTSVFINRTVGDLDNNQRERGLSFISATEIAG